MERRYLTATLALAATFAIFSGEFCTRYLAKVPHSTSQLKADIACAKHYVAKQLMAKLEPYVGRRDAEAPPMLAELNVPELPQAPAAPAAPVVVAPQKCKAAARSDKAPQQVIQMQIMSDDVGRQVNDLSIVRAELLSDRAQEWQTLANQRTLEINMKMLEQAQRISARAMEKAQRNIEKTRLNIAIPATPGSAIHINLVAPTGAMTPEAPEAPSPSIL